MLMGRRTYELLERDWATQSGGVRRLGERDPEVRKFVGARGSAGWNQARLVRDDAIDAIRELKADGDRELSIWGHGRLARTLLLNGLIDEIRVSVFPVIVGAGQTFYAEGDNARLRLTEALPASSNGVVALRYAVAR